jgi:hypothetical protein
MTLASAEVSPRVSGDGGSLKLPVEPGGALEDKESALLLGRGLSTAVPAPTKRVSAESPGFVQIIMAHPQGNALVDRLKFMILERMGKERSERDKIIALLVDTVTRLTGVCSVE